MNLIPNIKDNMAMKNDLTNVKTSTLFSILSTCSIVLIVTGCAKISTFSTNLDGENFKNYFSPSTVKIVESEAEFPGKYRFLGLVEGESCQQKAHHEQPNEIEARTEARRNAYKLKANAIIFSQCVLIADDQASKQCIASKVCYGRAFQVEPKNDQ